MDVVVVRVADLLEQARARGVVEVLRGQLLMPHRQAGDHLGGKGVRRRRQAVYLPCCFHTGHPLESWDSFRSPSHDPLLTASFHRINSNHRHNSSLRHTFGLIVGGAEDGHGVYAHTA